MFLSYRHSKVTFFIESKAIWSFQSPSKRSRNPILCANDNRRFADETQTRLQRDRKEKGKRDRNKRKKLVESGGVDQRNRKSIL